MQKILTISSNFLRVSQRKLHSQGFFTEAGSLPRVSGRYALTYAPLALHLTHASLTESGLSIKFRDLDPELKKEKGESPRRCSGICSDWAQYKYQEEGAAHRSSASQAKQP